MKYVSYDYELPYDDPHPENYWHIYNIDTADIFTGSLQIYGPQTEAMRAKIEDICKAIDAAIDLAQGQSMLLPPAAAPGRAT